jgi:hypothetical protein
MVGRLTCSTNRPNLMPEYSSTWPRECASQVWVDSVPSQGQAATRVADQPAFEPFGSKLQFVGPTWCVKARGGTTFGP